MDKRSVLVKWIKDSQQGSKWSRKTLPRLLCIKKYKQAQQILTEMFRNVFNIHIYLVNSRKKDLYANGDKCAAALVLGDIFNLKISQTVELDGMSFTHLLAHQQCRKACECFTAIFC